MKILSISHKLKLWICEFHSKSTWISNQATSKAPITLEISKQRKRNVNNSIENDISKYSEWALNHIIHSTFDYQIISYRAPLRSLNCSSEIMPTRKVVVDVTGFGAVFDAIIDAELVFDSTFPLDVVNFVILQQSDRLTQFCCDANRLTIDCVLIDRTAMHHPYTVKRAYDIQSETRKRCPVIDRICSNCSRLAFALSRSNHRLAVGHLSTTMLLKHHWSFDSIGSLFPHGAHKQVSSD